VGLNSLALTGCLAEVINTCSSPGIIASVMSLARDILVAPAPAPLNVGREAWPWPRMRSSAAWKAS
jgi:hypothetical protein